MVLIPRLHMDASGIRISRRGVNAKTVPLIRRTPEYLLFDSDWQKTTQIKAVIKVHNSYGADQLYFGDPVLDVEPFVELIRKQVGQPVLLDILPFTGHGSGAAGKYDYISQMHYIEWIQKDNVLLSNRTNNSLKYDFIIVVIPDQRS